MQNLEFVNLKYVTHKYASWVSLKLIGKRLSMIKRSRSFAICVASVTYRHTAFLKISLTLCYVIAYIPIQKPLFFISFVLNSQVFQANSDSTTPVTLTLPQPVYARIVRITCVTRNEGGSYWNIRFEILGCKIVVGSIFGGWQFF